MLWLVTGKRKILQVLDLAGFDVWMSPYGSLGGGERGIRTPGASQLNGFQDRRDRPLCHLSGDKNITEILLFQLVVRFLPFVFRRRDVCFAFRTVGEFSILSFSFLRDK